MPEPATISDVRKIAVLRPNAVGDFVFALPALHALRAAYPGARIVYIGKAWHADFLRDRPGPVDDVAVLPPCPGVGLPPDAHVEQGPLQAFIAAMREERFDLALQLYGGGHYSNPFIMQFGADLTLGLRADGAPPLDRHIAYRERQNRRLLLLEAAALAGADLLRLTRQPELQVTERDRREAACILPDLGARPLVVLQPGASDSRRHWPARRFAAVGDALAEQGAAIAVNGTAQEAPVVREVIGHMRHPALDLSGKLSLAGLCGVLERTALLVSNDTGPLHLALAIGTPGVGIYWLSNLIESGPLCQDRHRAALSTRIHCPVCGAENLRTRCAHDASFVDDVTLEEVIALALDLFRAREDRSCCAL
ncbi:glycosyltransferase family 9 protein [Noviherbaspirillum massiliense]|uniref:glycosyltransferase family 9 protein n=1 Tax=Noviherbaspirillum massiliense TaxID=1465823 RepID=UPI0002E522A5|nr:glycosyltransferase family 9 protein [Noviherbaspirillum massiliense]